MKKINVGDRVRMIEKGQYSFDRIGNTGTVIGFASDKLLEITVDGEDYPVFGNGWTYWVENENWEVIEEEVKVEKFKVGDKVRMVKLRSDGLSYSFDKIGNEGVVKDVGSDLIRVDVHCKDNTWEGNAWTYPLNIKCWELVEEESKLRVTSKVEPMCIYSFDSEEDMITFLKIADKDGFDVINCEYGIEENGLKNKFRVSNGKWVTYGTFAYDPPEYPEYERVQFKVEEEKEKSKTTVLKLGEYKIVFNGDTTVVTDGTRKGVAKRHPDDEYSAIVGLQVALERFHGGRKPEVGDKVRVLKVDGNSPYSDHLWEVGDVVTVVDIVYNSDSDKPHIRCFNPKSIYSYQRLIAGEYEVLG